MYVPLWLLGYCIVSMIFVAWKLEAPQAGNGSDFASYVTFIIFSPVIVVLFFLVFVVHLISDLIRTGYQKVLEWRNIGGSS
jgi:hypothetical protein